MFRVKELNFRVCFSQSVSEPGAAPVGPFCTCSVYLWIPDVAVTGAALLTRVAVCGVIDPSIVPTCTLYKLSRT